MEESGRGSAALVFPDPTSAMSGLPFPSPIATFNEVASLDMGVYKALLEWEKLHQKVAGHTPPGGVITTNSSSLAASSAHNNLELLISSVSKDHLKDRIKFVKFLSKLVPVILNCPNALNPVVAGNLLSAHWKTVGETLLICACRKIENTFVKETRYWALLIVVELFKYGAKPWLRTLMFALVLTEMEEKEGIPILGFPAPKLHELKVELEAVIAQDIEGFLRPSPVKESFATGGSKSKATKPQSIKGLLTDSRLALYLMFSSGESPAGSETFLLLEQIVKYTGFTILVSACKKWREAIVRGQSNVKVSIDVCVVLIIKQLFTSGNLQLLTTQESLMLKSIFCLILRDNYWFWDKIDALYLSYPGNLDLSPEEINLLLTLNLKLIRKLGKVYFSKTNEYKTTKLKIVQHLNKNLPEIFLRGVNHCLNDRYKQVCGAALLDLSKSLGLAALFTHETTTQSIGSSLCSLIKMLLETSPQKLDMDLLAIVISGISSETISKEIRLVCQLFFTFFQQMIQVEPSRQPSGLKSAVQLLKLFHKVFRIKQSQF